MMKTVGPHIVFAGGGTGGHLYPMLAVAQRLCERVEWVRLTFLTTECPIDRRVIRSTLNHHSGSPIEIIAQSVVPLPASLLGTARFIKRWRASIRLCRREFRRYKPAVVIGSGGYGSAPAISVARRMGIPTAILNPDAIPGKANRYLGSKVDAIFVQWPVTRRHFRRKAPVRVVGCPVRAEFSGTNRAAGIERFGLDPCKKTLLITGASQGARSINDAVVAIFETHSGAPGLSAGFGGGAGWQFLHLTGATDYEQVRAAYESRSVAGRVLAYTEHMADALAAADLVVSRAGASTLAEITAVGRASVLMPYPHHRDRHQSANAAVLAEAGAAVVVEDRLSASKNAPVLGKVLSQLMLDNEARGEMAARASILGTTGAAATIADAVLEMAGCDVPGGAEIGRDTDAVGLFASEGRAKNLGSTVGADGDEPAESQRYRKIGLPADTKVGSM